MKKFLALALILTLALSISVFAAGGRVVGNSGSNPSYDDGWTADDTKWNTANSDVEVDIKVTTNAYESRYAVDIEYTSIEFNVAASKMVWDVTKLQYVPKEDQSALTKPADQTITVKNYSDQPVTVSSDVEMEDDYAGSPMIISASADVTPLTVAKATPNDSAGNGGSATEGTVTISVNTADGKTWNDVATFFAPFFAAADADELVVATVTLTVSKP